jgi:hypothetical protein
MGFEGDQRRTHAGRDNEEGRSHRRISLRLGTIDATNTVIEYKPTVEFCLKGEAGGVRATSCLRLKGPGNATDIAVVGEYKGGTIFGFSDT